MNLFVYISSHIAQRESDFRTVFTKTLNILRDQVS